MEEKREIYNRGRNYETSLQRLDRLRYISEFNKHLIKKFLYDCELGKTINSSSKKKISVGRRLKLLYSLDFICRKFRKDFNKITQIDMETFILDLENDRIRKKNGEKFADYSKLDIKNVIKKFYKWYKGDSTFYPKLVSWIDTNCKEKLPEYLKLEEVNKLCKDADIQTSCLVKVLFDGGFRIGELINIKLKDIEKEEVEDGYYYKATANVSKTEPRTISLDLSTFELENWLKIHPDKENPEAYLFPIDYGAIRKRLTRLGMKVLNKRLHPHLLRHSSATYYAQYLNHHEICYRYGWRFSSDMPDIYISRSGMKEKQVVEKIRYSDRIQTENKLNKIERENQLLKEKFENWQRDNKITNRTIAKDLKTKNTMKKIIMEMLENGELKI